MPIKFISLNEEFVYQIQKQTDYEAHYMNITDYIVNKKTYYVCASNALCFFDRGFEQTISTILFPQLEKKTKHRISEIGKKTNIGSYYLPIGSSLIQSHDIDENKKVIISPIMLLPQDISCTLNAYYATMSILYNIIIIQKENIETVDILFSSFCCDYGMKAQSSIDQIIQGIKNYQDYINVHRSSFIHIYMDSLLLEIPLDYQPKYYQNTEWFFISSQCIIVPPKYNQSNSSFICTLSFFITGYIHDKSKKEQEFLFIEKKKYMTLIHNPFLEIKYYEIHHGTRRLVD